MTEMNKLLEDCSKIFTKYYENKIEIDECAKEMRIRLGNLLLCEEVTGKQREELRTVFLALDTNFASYEESYRRVRANIPGAKGKLETAQFELAHTFTIIRDFVMDYMQKTSQTQKITPEPNKITPSQPVAPKPPPDTEKELLEFIKQNPTDPRGYNALGNAYFSHRNFQEAIKNYEKANSLEESYIYYSNIGDAYRSLMDWDNSIFNYKKALALEPNDDIANNGIAMVYSALGKVTEAKRHYAVAVTTNPKPVYLVNLGMMNVAEGNFNEAIDFYETALEFDKNYAPAHSELAYAKYSQFLKTGDRKDITLLEEARNCYLRALDISPDTFSYLQYTGLGDVYLDLREFNKAVECYNESIKLAPGHSRAYNGRGRVNLALKNYAEALKDYINAFEIQPNNHIYAENIGYAYELQNNWDQAIIYYEKAHKLNEKDSFTLSALGRAYYNSGKFDQARKCFSELLDMDPTNFISHYWMGILAMKDANWDEAISYFEEATKLNPEDHFSFAKWGVASFYKGLFLRAAEKFLEAVKLYPIDPSYYHWLALINSKLRKWETAETFAFKCIEVAKGTNNAEDQRRAKETLANVYNEKGNFLYSKSPPNFEEAIKEYRKAIKVKEMPVYWSNLCNAYIATRNPKEAKQAIVEAIRLQPENQEYLETLKKL